VWRRPPSSTPVLFWITVALVATAVHLLQLRRIREQIREHIRREYAGARSPICLSCGFDLRGCDGPVCPECGHLALLPRLDTPV
jgi:hypothetical protein